MFTGWVTTMFTLQLNVYTVAISSVNKIVINEWLRLNNSGFLMEFVKRPFAPFDEDLFHSWPEGMEAKYCSQLVGMPEF